MFLDRVNIVSHYDRVVKSPSFEMRLALGRVAQGLCAAVAAETRPSRASTCSCATASPANIAASIEELTFDHVVYPLQGWRDDLGERSRRLLALQSAARPIGCRRKRI